MTSWNANPTESTTVVDTTGCYRILLIDDHRGFRESLARLVNTQPDFIVAAQAGNGDDGLIEMAQASFDLVILDVSMPGKNGFEVLREITGAYPGLPVVMLSMYPPEDHKDRALALGAAGYVTKDDAADDLIETLRGVLSPS